MYGEKSNRIAKRLEELEEKGKTDTVEYNHLKEKFRELRQKELKQFNKNYKANNNKRSNFL